jgi:hypothetical protein
MHGLAERSKIGEKEWYFFSLRDRKYPTGMRTNRATEAGYWKATGKDRDVVTTGSRPVRGHLVGMKKTLVFYKGRAPRGVKTNWIMHEYRCEVDDRSTSNLHHHPRLSKVFKFSCNSTCTQIQVLVTFVWNPTHKTKTGSANSLIATHRLD